MAAPSSGRRSPRRTIRRAARRGHRRVLEKAGAEAGADRPRRACHDALHQCADRAQGRHDRPAHHRGLPRRAGDRPRAQVRALRSLHRDAEAAGRAPVAARGRRAAGARRHVVEARSTSTALARGRRTGRARASRASPSCFLHAYANPAHERRRRRAIAERFPDLSISLSSDMAPEIREYLRAWHHGRQRLCPAAGRDLSRAARAGAARRGHSRRRCS